LRPPPVLSLPVLGIAWIDRWRKTYGTSCRSAIAVMAPPIGGTRKYNASLKATHWPSLRSRL